MGLAAMVGGMLFFAGIMTPLVFTKLAPDVSGPFIRAAFPRYYAYLLVSAGIGAAGFLLRGAWVSAVILLLVMVAVAWAWFWLIPHMNAWRDAGNMTAFDRGHSVSVWLNGVQLVAALVLLVRLAVGK